MMPFLVRSSYQGGDKFLFNSNRLKTTYPAQLFLLTFARTNFFYVKQFPQKTKNHLKPKQKKVK